MNLTDLTVPASPALERCSCDGPRRRICDECEGTNRAFLACSLACLERHRTEAHPDAPHAAAERVRLRVRESNRQRFATRLVDEGHRERVMGHIEQLASGGELCVFGAGNCGELDLERLVASFSEIHLVDLDGEALERARDAHGPAVRAKVVLHPDLDCSGLLEHLDDWGDCFPERRVLAERAVTAAEGIVRDLGRSFSLVVSTCLLSRLALPFQRAWLTSRVNWADLLSTLNAIHLATITGSTSPGGRGLIVFDAGSSRQTPALAELHRRSTEELEDFVAEAERSGGLVLRPEPKHLVRQMLAPGLRSLVADPELSSPWLWRSDESTELVYSLTFRHPEG